MRFISLLAVLIVAISFMGATPIFASTSYVDANGNFVMSPEAQQRFNTMFGSQNPTPTNEPSQSNTTPTTQSSQTQSTPAPAATATPHPLITPTSSPKITTIKKTKLSASPSPTATATPTVTPLPTPQPTIASTIETPSVFGDFNHDGHFDLQDIFSLLFHH